MGIMSLKICMPCRHAILLHLIAVPHPARTARLRLWKDSKVLSGCSSKPCCMSIVNIPALLQVLLSAGVHLAP